MPTRSALTFSGADRRTLATERYQHPDPRVPRRMEVLWLLSQGEAQARAGQLAGVSTATVERYAARYRHGGRAQSTGVPLGEADQRPGDASIHPGGRVPGPPPAHGGRAAQRTEAVTGVRRKETQVRAFLKKLSARGGGGWARSRCPRSGRWRSTPAPGPRSSGRSWSRRWRRRGRNDGPWFSWTPPTSCGGRSRVACGAWCGWFVRGASGRRRYNVLGAWKSATREWIRVTNDTRVSADTMIELLGRIAGQTPGPTTVVLDNARHQRCAAVEAEAKRRGIELVFLPPYSPNLNLIERLWKFTKKKALRGKHYADFAAFQAAIDDCLGRASTRTTARPSPPS